MYVLCYEWVIMNAYSSDTHSQHIELSHYDIFYKEWLNINFWVSNYIILRVRVTTHLGMAG